MTDINEVLEERGKTHGCWTKQAETSQTLKDVLTECSTNCLSHGQSEALQMICVKMSRIVNGNPNEPDHWKDIAGYATLVVKELEK